MLKMKNYAKVTSLEEAYELNKKRNNRILGGMLWMRMGDSQIQTGIDLSGLGLDQIEETDEEFRIGCMVTLRQIELDEKLNAYFDGLPRKMVENIVGVQFRNMATVGGSVFGRFGFSDVLTGMLVLDTYVELYQGGLVSLAEFNEMKKDDDILVHIIIKKREGKLAYLTHRNSKTDFPVLAVAVSKTEQGICVAVGATPARARAYEAKDLTRAEAERLAEQVQTGSNMRGSAEYRTHLAKVLIRRAFEELECKEETV